MNFLEITIPAELVRSAQPKQTLFALRRSLYEVAPFVFVYGCLASLFLWRDMAMVALITGASAVAAIFAMYPLHAALRRLIRNGDYSPATRVWWREFDTLVCDFSLWMRVIAGITLTGATFLRLHPIPGF